MLYPDFHDLMLYKYHKRNKMERTRRKMHATAAGNSASPFRGRGLDFDGVREYVLGDDIRNIDWKVTARTGSAHLKLFQEDKQHQTIICVDMNASMRFGTRGTFKSIQAARSASLLGWHALGSQDRLSACLFGDVPEGIHDVASKHTHKTLCRLLKMLAEPPKEQHRVPLETALQHLCRRARSGSRIYLISDFMDLSPAFLKDPSFIRLHKRCDLVFIAINDPADQMLFPAGVIGFCGQQAEKLLINTDSIKGRAAYAAAWETNRHALNSLTKRYHIPRIDLSTESNIQYALRLGLKNLTKGKKCLL